MDLDGAKENIQPLASGRNASILQATLQAESQQELIEKRKELELAIHQYKGDDPLEPWYDYIFWIEQSHPAGGKQSGFEEVLTKCLTRFENEKRYHQDRRMIKLYIKFIEMHKDPTYCYQQLFNESIGTMVADLYICWAYAYDLCGNYRRADEIFQQGIACRAEPIEELKEAHQHFGFTVAQRIMYKHDESEMAKANRELQERRLALTSLRRKVGSIRTGAAIKNVLPGVIKVSDTHARRGNEQVVVFNDENVHEDVSSELKRAPAKPPSPVPSKKSIIHSLIKAAKDQENIKEPGPWDKASLKKNTRLFEKEPPALAFDILEDDTNAQGKCQSDNTIPTVSIKSCKPFPSHKTKNKPQPDWQTPVTTENVTAPGSLPSYDKCKLYPRPNAEFQPEELRGYNWLKKRSIKNTFTSKRDVYWSDEHISNVRQYPNFAKKCTTLVKDTEHTFHVPEKDENLQIDFGAVYDIKAKEEFQFEELLFKRWQDGKRKMRFDPDDTILFPTEMDETVCAPHDSDPVRRRKSFFPGRKSVAFTHIRSPTLYESAASGLTKNLNASKDDLAAASKLNTASKKLEYPTSSATSSENANESEAKPFKIPVAAQAALPFPIYEDSFDFKMPAVLSGAPKNPLPFEIYEEPTIPKSKSPAAISNIPDECNFEADETCSTQVFNCFIKSQSVSTPKPKSGPRVFGTLLKEIAERTPPKENAENCKATVSDPPQSIVSTPLTCSPPQKQLSTILETSEQGTTKSISSPDSEVDSKAQTATTRILVTQTPHMETVAEEKSINVSREASPKQQKSLNQPRLAVSKPDTVEIAVASKNLGNFSRVEQPDESIPHINPNAFKFQEDKTETIARIMAYKSDGVKFTEEQTETISKMLLSSLKPINDAENKDEALPEEQFFKVPATELRCDSPFDFFTQSPPAKGLASLLTPQENAAKKNCNYDTPELFNKVSTMLDPSKKSLNFNQKQSNKIMETSISKDNGKLQAGIDEPFDFAFIPETQLASSEMEKQNKISLHDFSFNFSFSKETSKVSATKEQDAQNNSFVPETQPGAANNLKENVSSKFYSVEAPPIKSAETSASYNKPTLLNTFELLNFSSVEHSQPAVSAREVSGKSKQSDPLMDIKDATADKLANKKTTPKHSLESNKNDEAMSDLLLRMSNDSDKENLDESVENNLRLLKGNQIKEKSLHIKEEPSFWKIECSQGEAKESFDLGAKYINNSMQKLRIDGSAEKASFIANNTRKQTVQPSETAAKRSSTQPMTGADLPILLSDDEDYGDDALSIYVQATPKTPHNFWNDGSESPSRRSGFVHNLYDMNETQQRIDSICLQKNCNPFDDDLLSAFLDQVNFTHYIDDLPNCELVGKVKQIFKEATVQVNDTKFKVHKFLGSGRFGSVFYATECKTGKKYALKQERPANYWEYYICLEVRARLPVDDLLPAFIEIEYALFGNNASILISNFGAYGNLISVCNKIKKATQRNLEESVVMHLSCQLLDIMDHLHAIGIIHADVKADNFLLMNKLSFKNSVPSVQLIDFGVAIDMRLYQPEQCFTYSHKTKSAQCIEMRENRPWTYQLDLFGLCGVIHTLLFGKYMDVEKKSSGLWMPKTYIPRYMNKSLWENIFKTLLNVRDCKSMPNMQNLRTLIKQEMAEKETYAITKINDFNRALES